MISIDESSPNVMPRRTQVHSGLPIRNTFVSPVHIGSIHTIILIGLCIRVFVAIWNGYFGPSFGAEADAATFHKVAVEFSQDLSFEHFDIRHIYPYYLGFLYFLTVGSLFLGSLLSCFVWYISAILLVKTMRLLFYKVSQMHNVILIFSFLPSSILFTSVTLRESYQLMFINLSIYSALMIITKKSSTHWILLVSAVIGSGVLHGTLFAFGVFIIALTMLFLMFPKGKKIPILKIIFILPLIGFVLAYGFSSFTSIFNYKLEMGLIEAVEAYQRGGLGYLEDARAFYKTSVEINGLVGFLQFVPVSLVQYLFEPMPWRVSTLSDIFLFFENILRGFLIWRACVGLKHLSGHSRRLVLFIFLSYLVIETIWSLGTINWGTAVRHHIPGMGMSVVAGFSFSRRLSSRARRRRFAWLRNSALSSSPHATR